MPPGRFRIDFYNGQEWIPVMRRADRLFQIIQILRGSRKPVTARTIARELETSPRTIYRDIADLMLQQIPIRGEAGVGYMLDEGYDMPPLMLTPPEIEAAVLGAQWVIAQGDQSLVRGARDLITKIGAVIPTSLRPIIMDCTMLVPVIKPRSPDAIDISRVRDWIRSQRRIRLFYRDERDSCSERVVWPIAVAYFESVRLIVTWCELRGDFRHFRTDRIIEAEFLDETFPTPVEQLRKTWWAKESERFPTT